MDFFNQINASWRDMFNNKPDPRVADLPLMSSPFPTIAICLSYCYIVKVNFHLKLSTRQSFTQCHQVLGPRLMENRKPFQFRKFLIAYNFMHVLISFYIFLEGGVAGWFGKYNWRCEAFDPSRKPTTMRVRGTKN